ncbi:Uncharacterised protein [Salmonella enterica subsp. enterica serovar Typhi]|nr:Uncharacterised protein [Salmonella enterica subsp. enterica serovar Typhi]CGY06947.1 Uncharacterised protein [Salmonella enterica subsp. enterica serovar Typhi]CGY52547.1 Uncharacterised protein [Salmonella enterica subsp. enterica serovar Typhi]CHL80604.1 Uncharacterised protein [Salmonella enterica subsp. enterica serovar Typhi]CRC20064.1 Uncharacterised protein [Salmonella enterica subsp. enterica serovar Typhi]
MRERLAFRIFRMQPLTKPVIDRRLAKMTERRITDVVHQTGHFHNTFKGTGQRIQTVLLQSVLLFQAA